MGKTLGLLLIVIASGLLIYWIVGPVLLPTASQLPSQTASPTHVPAVTGSPEVADPGSGAPNATVSPLAPLAPPRTPQQQATDELEARRAPYYEWIRRVAGDRVSDVTVADDDRATLVLTARADTPDMVTSLAHDVVYPYAFQYGFRHVRFYVPNAPGSVERYRFDAEANCDKANHWNVFKK